MNVNERFKFTLTSIKTHPLFVQGQHDTVPRTWMRSRHHHFIVFGQYIRLRLRPHTTSNTNNSIEFKYTPIQINAPTVRAGRVNMAAFHKHKVQPSSIILQCIWTTNQGAITTASNTNNNTFEFNHAPIQTYFLFVQGRHDTIPWA